MPRPNSISHLIKLEDVSFTELYIVICDKRKSETKILKQIRDEIIKNFDGNENQLTGDKLCLGDIELLKKWHFDGSLTMNTSNLLTESVRLFFVSSGLIHPIDNNFRGGKKFRQSPHVFRLLTRI